MKKLLAILSVLCALSVCAHAAPSSTTIAAEGGAIRITPILHASMQIEYRGLVIHVDPFSMGDYSRAKKADVVLITDIHPDHLDVPAISKIRKSGSLIFLPKAAATEMLSRVKGKSELYGTDLYEKCVPIANGQRKSARLFSLEAVPMYNLVRGPKPGAKFHTKGRGNGYILTLGGKRIYIAGDTEVTPEMKKLREIDLAFLPMNLPFSMTPQEAAQGAKAFKPKIAIPYHYRYPFDKANDNPQRFEAALKGTKIQVRLLEWYPVSAVKTATRK